MLSKTDTGETEHPRGDSYWVYKHREKMKPTNSNTGSSLLILNKSAKKNELNEDSLIQARLFLTVQSKTLKIINRKLLNPDIINNT